MCVSIVWFMYSMVIHAVAFISIQFVICIVILVFTTVVTPTATPIVPPIVPHLVIKYMSVTPIVLQVIHL